MEQSIAAIVLMVASGVSAGAEPATGTEVYRWKDGSGLVHYSDTPPTNGSFTRVRLASSLTTSADAPAPLGGVAEATSGAGAVDPKPAEAPLQKTSAFARRNCTEAQEQLQYGERRATEKPVDDPRRANSRELEDAYQRRLTAYNRYQTARDALLLRVGRHCAE